MQAQDRATRIAQRPVQWIWRTLVVWLTPFALFWATRFIPQDPNAPANMFGQIGARQTARVWLAMLTIPIHLLLGYLLVRRMAWLGVAWVYLIALLLIVVQFDSPVTQVVGNLVVVTAPLVGYWIVEQIGQRRTSSPPPDRALL